MKRHLNLIPPSTQRRQALRRVSRVGSTAMVVSGLVAGSLLGVEWLRGVNALHEKQTLEARYAPFVAIAKQHDQLAEQIARLRGREQLSLRLSHEAHGVSLLGALALAASEAAGSVYVESLAYRTDDTGAGSSVRVEGAGVDGAAVAVFAEKLRQSGVFEEVAVESTGALPSGATSLRRFRMACRL